MRIANLLIILLFSIGLAPIEGVAQTASNRWALSLGTGVATYQSFPNAGPSISPMFDPVYAFSALRYLRGGFDFRTQIAASPKVRYPMSDAERMNSNWMDMSYQLLFKLNNGVFFRENAFIGPYMVLGIGGSYVENMPDAYIPLGGGIRFRLGPRSSIRVETIKKISLNKQPQQLNHMIAFVYNLKEEPQPQGPEIENRNDPRSVLALIPQDLDQDGIADIEDHCPDKAGLPGLSGCPENDTVSTIFVQANDPTRPTIDPYLPLEETMPQTQEDAIQYHPEAGIGEATEAIASGSLEEPMGELGSLADLRYEAEPETHLSDLNYHPTTNQPKTSEKYVRRPEIDLSPCGEYAGNPSLQSPVLFEMGSDQLGPDELAKLDYIAGAMQSCSDINLMLDGHADATGGEDTNLVLSIMRAYNVKYYLVYHHGINQHRIISAGLGETQPVADNSSLNGREQNRRVAMQFVF